ncbi:MAG: dephospho-CoA kinase, partial [Pseudomonadota bacterium]
DDIVRHFGQAVLGPDGALDRRALRARIFAEPAERRALERITHPRIRAVARARTAAADGPYAVLVVPLLVESGAAYPSDRTLVVDCDRDTRIERLTARDGVTRAAAEAMLNAQARREARLAVADDVVTNDGTLAALLDATDTLHRRYERMAAQAAR